VVLLKSPDLRDAQKRNAVDTGDCWPRCVIQASTVGMRGDVTVQTAESW
jgi:hypothetical protein